jgi:arylsulfatase A-like enzyme
MRTKDYLLAIIKITFIIFSLKFIRDAFFKWDGFSYYMKFSAFLPELSLSFLLWTTVAFFVGVGICIILLLLFRMISWLFTAVKLSDVISWFIIIAAIALLKIVFFRFPLENIPIAIRIVGVILTITLAAAVTWKFNHYTELILSEIMKRISPLLWIFVSLLVIAIPLSFFGGANEGEYEVTHNRISYENKKPNIIMIIMDTLSAQHMSLYNYEINTTPFISEWAEEAVVFEDAYSPSNWTSSSVMSIMTGQRLWTHGFWYMNKQYSARTYGHNFPRLLRENGYEVASFVQNYYAHPDTLGIRAGFDVADKHYLFENSSGWWFDYFKGLLNHRPIVQEWLFETNSLARLIISLGPDREETLVPPDLVYNRFLEYLEKHNRQKKAIPFFAWLQVLPPHSPYLPPDDFEGKLGDADLFNSQKQQEESGLLETEYSPERQGEIDILRKRYDEFIMYSDQRFREFIYSLKGIVDPSNTVIIFLSDHGESFSKGYQGHGGQHLYESLVHVPLIIRMPGQKEGLRVDTPVEMIDIAPTILDIAGIPVPDWVEGVSLLPVINGIERASAPVFSMQFINNRAEGEPISKGTIAVRSGNYKLVDYLEESRLMLYDVERDPHETVNLITKKPAVANSLKKLLEDELKRANNRKKEK